MRQKFHEWCVSSGREKGKEFFSTYYVQKPRPWFHEWDLNRRTTVSINRLRNGHHSLRASLFRFNIVPSAMCPCVLADETVNHVFWQCTRFVEQRAELVRRLTRLYGLLPHSIECVFVCRTPER